MQHKSLAKAVAAVALAVLRVVSAGGAYAHAPNDQRGVQPATRPAQPTRDQQALTRILAREHHAYPAPLDPQAQAAQQALARTLAREYHAYPAAGDAQQPANPRQAARSRTLSTLAVLAMIVVLAMTWRRRARSRFREAL